MGLMDPSLIPDHSIQDAFVGSKSHMIQDTLTPPDRGRPRSRRRAVTDPFHFVDTSLNRGPSERSRAKAGPAAKRQRYINMTREGHPQQYSDRSVARIIPPPEITGPAYQDQTRPSPLGQFSTQPHYAADLNRTFNRQHDMRNDYLQGVWRRPDPWVRGSLASTKRRPRKLPITIGRKHQQHQSLQAHVGSVINTHDRDSSVSRDRPIKARHHLSPSPAPEVPQSIFAHKLRPSSEDAVLIRYPELRAALDTIHAATRDSLPVNECAAEEQPGHSIPQSRPDSVPLLSTSMEAVKLLSEPVPNVEPTTPSLAPPQGLPRSVRTKALSPPLALSHYTISQDHTAGEDYRKSSLLASFSKRGYSSFR